MQAKDLKLGDWFTILDEVVDDKRSVWERLEGERECLDRENQNRPIIALLVVRISARREYTPIWIYEDIKVALSEPQGKNH